MGRPRKISTEAPEVLETVETSPTDVVETGATEAPEVLETVEVSAYDRHGNFVRTYSKEIHGDDFMEKAREFATQGYTIR